MQSAFFCHHSIARKSFLLPEDLPLHHAYVGPPIKAFNKAPIDFIGVSSPPRRS